MQLNVRRRSLSAAVCGAMCLALLGVAPSASADDHENLPGEPTITLPINDSEAGGTYDQDFTRVYAGVTTDGTPVYIYVPAGTAEKTLRAIADQGAQVVQTDLRYDDVVRAAASSTMNRPAEILIQDTAWPGYEEIPHWIVDGYGTMLGEIDAQLGERTPDLIAVPTGVGSLLQAALQHYRGTVRQRSPAVLAVEPVTAACVTASLAAGKPISVDTSVPTIMAGLNCGTVSTIAWPAIRDTPAAAVVVTDEQARAAMHRLHELGVPAGPSGAASLAGVRAALGEANQRTALATRADSVVVLISTDGAV